VLQKDWKKLLAFSSKVRAIAQRAVRLQRNGRCRYAARLTAVLIAAVTPAARLKSVQSQAGTARARPRCTVTATPAQFAQRRSIP
jgi:uncharacterized MAPEG superfamily protein